MQKDNRFFNDFSKFINGLAGTMAGMGREAQNSAKERTREWLITMDFVPREELEAVKTMAINARLEAKSLKLRVEALERQINGKVSEPINEINKPSGSTKTTKSPSQNTSSSATPAPFTVKTLEKDLGVKGNAVRKRLRKHQIPLNDGKYQWHNQSDYDAVLAKIR